MMMILINDKDDWFVRYCLNYNDFLSIMIRECIWMNISAKILKKQLLS